MLANTWLRQVLEFLCAMLVSSCLKKRRISTCTLTFRRKKKLDLFTSFDSFQEMHVAEWDSWFSVFFAFLKKCVLIGWFLNEGSFVCSCFLQLVAWMNCLCRITVIWFLCHLYFKSSLDLILQLNFWEGTEAILSFIFIGLVKIPSVVESAILEVCLDKSY